MASAPKRYFICGIGGSGMMPLAVILKGMGHDVSGSDRSREQGRTPEKFAWLEKQGITLFPQDGSGIAQTLDGVVVSKAIEDSVPDIARAKALGIDIVTRARMLITFFNTAKTRIAIAGTSGKTTTTGMTGFLLREAGLAPTVMNGGIFRNDEAMNPYATAFVGQGDIFVTEVDESDGADIMVLYEPDIAVLHNITLDHQPMSDLKAMFDRFIGNTKTAIFNLADDVVREMAGSHRGSYKTYGAPSADFHADGYVPRSDGCDVTIHEKNGGQTSLSLQLPGRHNVSNALAAISVGRAIGISLHDCAEILSRFQGIRRRMEIVGRAQGITVIDDFAHNPDKVAATLQTLKEFRGRVHMFFQPHGYGFLKVVGPELAESFAEHMDKDDVLYIVEPFYAGGTVDRSVGSSSIVDAVSRAGKKAFIVADRAEAQAKIMQSVGSGDRVVVMGARDDSLSAFARAIYEEIVNK